MPTINNLHMQTSLNRKAFIKLLSLTALFLILSLSQSVLAQTSQVFQGRVIAWSPDGSVIAVAGGPIICIPYDSTELDPFGIRIFDAANGTLLKTLLGNTCMVTMLDWSPDGSKLLSAGIDSYGVRVWDIATGQVIVTDQLGGGQGITSARWSPDGTKWVSGEYTNVIVVSNALTGEPLGHVDIGGRQVDWSPDGSKLASTYDNKIAVADVNTGKHLMDMEGHTDDITSIDWNPVEDTIATGSADQTVKIWDAATGQLVQDIEVGAVAGVRWSPDGGSLAIVYEGTIQIWDVWQQTQVANFIELGKNSLADWSPDSTQLAYFDNDTGEIRIITLEDAFPEVTPDSAPT